MPDALAEALVRDYVDFITSTDSSAMDAIVTEDFVDHVTARVTHARLRGGFRTSLLATLDLSSAVNQVS